jgi:hypothetical protein
MRNMWEGGMVGEGYLRGMKKELKQGMIGKWQVWTLKNLLEKDMYQGLIGRESRIKPYDRSIIENECVIHRTEEHASKSFESGEPVSGIIINGNVNIVYLVYRNKERLCYKEIYVEAEEPIVFFNCEYYRVAESDNDGRYETHNQDITNIIGQDGNVVGVLLLPKLDGEIYRVKNKNTLYCMVRSDWN